jgi:hypothetical protein
MPGQYFLIAPGSRTSWSHRWDDFLAEDESISSRQWTVSPVHADTSPETPTLSGQNSDVVFIEAPREGYIYTLTEAIVTNLGVQDSRSITLRCG